MKAAITTIGGEIAVYQAEDGTVVLKVRLEHDSLWLSQRQIALLFDKDSDTIGLHLRNIYSEAELSEAATTEESSVVQIEGNREVRRKVRLYNLDAIISVGYRVNSKRGTQFRIWATHVLHDHLVKGYSANTARLHDLRQAVRLIADTAIRRDVSTDEARGLLEIVGEYNRALELLDDYDHQRITKPDPGAPSNYMLYFLVKNHAFVDGNKRIAAALFLWYLERNNGLLKNDGTPRLSNGTLVALTLMIAESRPEEKHMLVRIVMHLLHGGDS